MPDDVPSARLGLVPMALYKHVADKEDLVGRMVDQMVEGHAPPTGAVGWRDRVRSRVMSAREAVLTHPWLGAAILKPTGHGAFRARTSNGRQLCPESRRQNMPPNFSHACRCGKLGGMSRVSGIEASQACNSPPAGRPATGNITPYFPPT